MSTCAAPSMPSSRKAQPSKRIHLAWPASAACAGSTGAASTVRSAPGTGRRRRITSKEVLIRRLLAFDYVLDHPQLPWLPTEPEKMAAFEALSVERRLLPRRVYRGAAGNLRRYFRSSSVV